MKEIHYCYCGRSDRHDKGPECEKPRIQPSTDWLYDQDEYERRINETVWPRGPSSPINGGQEHG